MRRFTLMFFVVVVVSVFAAACSPAPPAEPHTPATATTPSLGIRPAGDTEIQPDLTQIPPDLQKVYAHIDEHIDEHVSHLQKWIQQPSVSNSGEGIPESAEMVKGFFDELGCQQTQKPLTISADSGMPSPEFETLGC